MPALSIKEGLNLNLLVKNKCKEIFNNKNPIKNSELNIATLPIFFLKKEGNYQKILDKNSKILKALNL